MDAYNVESWRQAIFCSPTYSNTNINIVDVVEFPLMQTNEQTNRTPQNVLNARQTLLINAK